MPIPVSVEIVTGLTNRSWKFKFDNGEITLWRPVSQMTRAFNISRRQEFEILQYLATQPSILAPKPLFVNSQGLMVEWLEGSDVASIDDSLLLTLTSQLHQLDVHDLPLVPFQYTARIDHYWLQLVETHYVTPPLIQCYHNFRIPPTVEPCSLRLCHFDIGPHNLIKNTKGYHFIDWEYATLADPRIELAMLVAHSNQEIAPLVLNYCRLRHIEPIDDWILGVEMWLPRVRFMALLWYFLAHRYTNDDAYLSDTAQILASLCREDHCLLHENNQ
jgi:thiamine kinase